MRKIIFLIASIFVVLAGCKKKEAIDPDTASQMVIHRNLGLAYLEENKLREAGEEFQKLIKLAPREPLGYANLGLTYLRMRELEPAESWLQQALQQEQDDPEIRLLLAKVYEQTDRENQAIRTLENALKKNPNHLRTL